MNDKIQVVYMNEDYRGHYSTTPYSFTPDISHKLIANPFTDFGQGLLETLKNIHITIIEEKSQTNITTLKRNRKRAAK